MVTEKQVSLNELAKFGSAGNINEQAKSLIAHQKSMWELVRLNFNALQSIQIKPFDFGHFRVVAQFNPGRIRSSAAKLDAKSIAERPCFLCVNNLPVQQSGLVFQDKYLILANPYPIFPYHLTISHREHTIQEIGNYFPDMLDLSKSLNDFTVFYNGPRTGASAPDHLHFQAVGKNSLPVETEFDALEAKFSETLMQNENLKIFAVESYFRTFIAIVSANKNEITQKFQFIYKNMVSKNAEEPMLNLLCSFNNGKWRIIIFPREKQRPSHFFRDDDAQLVISPAAVELGGVFVLPREEDFNKITGKQIQEIYREVTVGRRHFEKLKIAIRSMVTK